MKHSINRLRIKRKARKERRPFGLLTFFFYAGLCVLLSVAYGVLEHSKQSPPVADSSPATPDVPLSKPPVEEKSTRANYSHSVIPGGVRDRDELVDQILRDPVVASHYAGFDASAAQVVQIPKTMFAYVSYRINNKIYWTSKKVKLAQGEKLISDGRNLARTRCGNRVSSTAQLPTSIHEPTAEAFEKWLDISIDPITGPSKRKYRIQPDDATPSPNHKRKLALPTLVPEPGTLTLLVSGLAAYILLMGFASRNRKIGSGE